MLRSLTSQTRPYVDQQLRSLANDPDSRLAPVHTIRHPLNGRIIDVYDVQSSIRLQQMFSYPAAARHVDPGL